MADSVQGLAAQAESLADQLLAKSPMLPRRGATSSRTNAAALSEVPPPDPKGGGPSPAVLIGSGVGAVLVAPVAMIAGFYGIGDTESKKSALQSAQDDYRLDPASADSRRRLVAAANDVESAAMLNNCLLAPLGWLSVPLCCGGLGVTGWGIVSAVNDKGGEE
jgi:hypothetical protein